MSENILQFLVSNIYRKKSQIKGLATSAPQTTNRIYTVCYKHYTFWLYYIMRLSTASWDVLINCLCSKKIYGQKTKKLNAKAQLSKIHTNHYISITDF